ncbi:MAG: hypothetical protein LBE61_09755 [Burkholderiaceae bacterium]|jgi:hypothetical protein|nr:hypothetical protein [Burkholderiaceae bacterium]
MGEYLVHDRVLVVPAPVPERVTTANILLVHPHPDAELDPWAIGTGGDAASPFPPPVLPLPAREFEMRFDATAGEAAVCLLNIETLDVLSISYSAGIWGSGTSAGVVAGFKQVEVPSNLPGPLSLRLLTKVLTLIDGEGAERAVFTPADLGIASWSAFVPLAFSATNNYEGEGNSRHCMGMDAIIDIMYDGVLSNNVPAFWQSFVQTREEL